MTDPTIQPPADEQIQDTSPGDSTLLGLGFAWELGYTIAVPAILFGVAGGYADKYVGTSPLFLLLGIVLAFVTSAMSVTKKVRLILSKIPKTLPKKPEEGHEQVKEQHDFHDFFRPNE